MSEKNIQSLCMLAASQAGATVFRNSIGRGVLGQFTRNPDGTFLVKHGRVVDFGVCNPGGSDLIGWMPVKITADMVGRTVAVFLSLEVKTPTGRATDDQKNFIAAVRRAGGLAGVVRSPDEAVAVCNPLLGVE